MILTFGSASDASRFEEAVMMFVPVITEDNQKEEEGRLLAALIQQDSAGTYEYKILHGWFHKPERMQEILDEEARSQWELALKLDDQRLVLRRLRDARSRDPYRDSEIDPYRTELSTGRTVWKLTIVLGMMIAGVLTWVLFSRSAETPLTGAAAPVIWVLASIFALVFLLIFVRRRR
jgi:hypothetical protein